MRIILFDTVLRNNLFPLTLTKAVADLRPGILTIKERWQKISVAEVFVLTDFYLQILYPAIELGEYLFIDATIIPTTDLIPTILHLKTGECISDSNGLIAFKTSIQKLPSINDIALIAPAKNVEVDNVRRISSTTDLFLLNDEMLRFDFTIVTKGRVTCNVNETVQRKEPSQIFIEEGAIVDFSILNASTGPIYIGKNATVMEGCTIRGPFSLGEGATLKMGTRVYGATTLGPYCTGGGEIKNSVMMGYSNKGHDGYLGDSVVGEWCNFGAGTSTSNVKNTGGEVNLWNYKEQQFLPIGNKCGVVMGDYSRTAINTSINTGTVIGLCCNLFYKGLTPKFIPDFSWGENAGSYEFKKALKDIGNWKKMKNKTLTDSETQILKHIFDLDKKIA
ncbi:MAG TPA: putative sugar nucleotidyl transferase [Segetibacter sp.]|jgi:UDP-N-acetylglucosamine diphosphorylase/glucosamine-1-phosphate N-acetyltransferase